MGDALAFLRGAGCIIVKFTSGGIDRGARPICDGREEEVEKGRETTGKAGRRNEGREIDDEEAIAFSSPLDLAVESIFTGGCLQRARGQLQASILFRN